MAQFVDLIINRKSPALDRVFTYSVPTELQSELTEGMLVSVPFNREKLEGVVIRLHDEPPELFTARDIAAIISERPLFSRELLQLSRWLADYYHCSRAAALQAMLPAGMNLAGRLPQAAYYDCYRLAEGYRVVRESVKRKALTELLLAEGELDAAALKEQGFERPFLQAAVKAGLLVKERRRLLREAEAYATEAAGFSEEQQAVYEDIVRERAAANRPYLLHGVTGSGKTEIYLRLIADAAARGQQSILLLPEIALSAQMVDMLSRRLELPLALLHSGLLASERRRIWQEIAEGRYSVVVGARSAVFAPLPALGLIIIDEEQENSYKQENVPRFHAVATAVKRAELCGSQLVLGSATPSVESYYAAEQGTYSLGYLSRQYYPAPQPEVSIVDMRQELAEGHKLIFSRELIAALAQTLTTGDQAVLFLNRRGYYSFISCRDCGQSIVCSHCAVALSYHAGSDGGRLKCHYCGAVQAPPQVCPHCGSRHIRSFGVGTQRVAGEAARLFPGARIARLDSDVMEERGWHERVYEQMQRRQIDILVGTQMVAKGLDFPHLQLAAVIAADTMLNLPDWRAGEHTFQLISQLIGRAGRRERQGRAIIQTYTPEALPIAAAANYDYLGFYHHELEQRQLHGYPPYNHLLRLLFSSEHQGELVEATAAYAYYLAAELAGAAEICGPADAPYPKIKDRWRRQILVKAADSCFAGDAAERAWATTLGAERLPRDILFSLDIDPMSLF
jgi:primosomal protein N' (replication factor Y) (superfamily II helicase)